MNKSNLIFAVSLLWFSFFFGQQKDTIYGKVKTVREQINFLDKNRQNMKLFSTEGDYGHYGFSSAEFTKSRFHNWWYNTPWVHYSNYFKEINEKGQTTYEIWFYKDGDTVTTYKYKYDKKDNLIQKKDIFDENDYTCRNYTYDYKNKLRSTIYYASDDPNLYSYTTYVRDSLANLIEIIRFDEDGELASWKYKYDSKNRKISMQIHKPYIYVKKGRATTSKRDSIGLTKLCEKYYYDTEDNLIETHYFNYSASDNLPSKLSRKVKNEYEDGLLKKVIYSRDTINSFKEYQYDNNRRIIKETVTFTKYSDNNLSTQYFYDNTGNIIKLIYTEKNKPVSVEFEYEFDKQNNWTTQIKSVNGEKLFVWTRKIQYYE
ncbi:hypothetical protein [Psychroserpens sp. XS_ASV72]|uniref:hypothetical protein n=1 Tax=Psychroserpens sp. XS_ASV72 TaxID=3241293 RepID=UPI003516D2AC